MLSYCRITFRLELLALLHVGDGDDQPLAELRRGHPHLKIFQKNQGARSDAEGLVRTQQRAVGGVPCIEGSSLRGALRSLTRTAVPEAVERLFGPEAIGEGDDPVSGRLWLYGGSPIANGSASSADLPFWDGYTCILTGNRVDLDLGAVQNGFLYMTEYCAPGMIFAFEAVYCGVFDEFDVDAGPLVAHMSEGSGFALGAESGHGRGRARLIGDSLSVSEHIYAPKKKLYDVRTYGFQDLTAVTAHPTEDFATISLSCDGPFWIQDPYARAKDGDPDMRELRFAEGRPIFSGKAFLQELRRRVARLEIHRFLSKPENGFDYESPLLPLDDFDRHLRPEQKPESLTATQRLFGVPGWGKVVHVIAAAVARPKARHRMQGIQLDVFTQAPIDGALLNSDVPAGIAVDVRLGVDRGRYDDAMQRADEALLRTALDEMRLDGFQPTYGHASGAGYGWFTVTSPKIEHAVPTGQGEGAGK